MTDPLIAALQPLLQRVRTDATCIKKADGTQAWTREPITEARLAKHLNGGPARGVAPIKAGQSVTMVSTLDLDSHKGETPWPVMIEAARAITETLELLGMRSVAWRSSGGRGIHIFTLWDEPQDAYSVRAFMSEVLAACGYRNGTKGVQAGEVEIFPKQDSVAADGFGNQFILPLAGASEPLIDFIPAGRDAAAIAWPTSPAVPVLARPERQASAPTSVEFAQLRAALAAIPNEGDHERSYDQWRDIVFGVHQATGGNDEGLALVHEFSARSAKYDPAFLEARVWPYVRDREGGITARSILAAAREHGWIEPIEDDFDVVEPEPAAPPKVSKFELVQAGVFAAGTPPGWIVKGVLPRAELVVIFGESGAGKTFAVLDLVAAIARGVDWRGCRVTKGRVIYVAAEGAGGLRNRLGAYAVHHGIDLASIDLFVVAAAPNLLEKTDALDLARAIAALGPASVVVIDTLAQTTPGGNENAAEDMGKAMAHCKGIHRATGALVLLVHHAGKDSSKGARGWSGLRAAADAELEVVRMPTARVLRVTKQKDGDDNGQWAFDLQDVPLGMDDDGDIVGSCAVIEAPMPVLGSAAKPMGRVETIVNQVIQEFATAQVTGIEVNAVLTEAARRLPPPEDGRRDTRKQHAKRALKSLTTGDEAPYFLEDDGTLSVG